MATMTRPRLQAVEVLNNFRLRLTVSGHETARDPGHVWAIA